MDKSFHLDIVTPEKVITEGQVTYLRAPSPNGLFGVMSGHTESIISISIGEIKVVSNGKVKYFSTSGGFADIKKEGVVLLLETIELSTDIDTDRANKSMEKAQSNLKTSGSIDDARDALARARNRLKVSNKLN
tara:strand:- start:838 stop:1236 length:399 start_codon:yes stop_codon:yes gene_type:complete